MLKGRGDLGERVGGEPSHDISEGHKVGTVLYLDDHGDLYQVEVAENRCDFDFEGYMLRIVKSILHRSISDVHEVGYLVFKLDDRSTPDDKRDWKLYTENPLDPKA